MIADASSPLHGKTALSAHERGGWSEGCGPSAGAIAREADRGEKSASFIKLLLPPHTFCPSFGRVGF